MTKPWVVSVTGWRPRGESDHKTMSYYFKKDTFRRGLKSVLCRYKLDAAQYEGQVPEKVAITATITIKSLKKEEKNA